MSASHGRGPVGPDAEHDGFAAIRYGWSAFRNNARPLLLIVVVPLSAELVVALLGKALIDSAARRFLFQISGIVLGAIAALGYAGWR